MSMSNENPVRLCVRRPQEFKGSPGHPNGRTKRSFGKQCDINAIVDKARKTGFVSHVNSRSPIYADVTNVPDLAPALAIVNNARDQFSALPADIRDRFNNDPVKMVDFLRDSKNLEESYRIGLRVKPVVPPEKVQKVEIVNPGSNSPTPKA